jgi:hypothetical protein
MAVQYLEVVAEQSLKAMQLLYDDLHCKDDNICID